MVRAGGALSPATAMRAFAALLILLCSCRLHAHKQTRTVNREPDSIPGVSDGHIVRHLLSCTQTLGPSKCLTALGVWRADRALEAFANDKHAHFNLTADVERFSWKEYSNSSEEQLYSQLCDGTERLLQYRSLSLVLPTYTLELESKGNGRLNVDIFKNNETESGRGSMKKMHKLFYKIVPFLMVPGLIMAAILPFVLPALKMMTVAVGMLNNMALTGAIFTLLRNNAFNDRYDHKVLYYNAGYKNEKHAPVHFEEEVHHDNENYDIHYSETKTHGNINDYSLDNDFDAIEESPLNYDWTKEYHDGNKYFTGSGSSGKRYPN